MNNIYDENDQVLGQVQQIENFTNINLGNIRVADIYGFPYFCLVDTLRILGINSNHRSDLIRDIDIPTPTTRDPGIISNITM